MDFLVFVCACFGIPLDWVHCIGFGTLCISLGSGSLNRKCHTADNISLWPGPTAQRPKGVCLGRGIISLWPGPTAQRPKGVCLGRGISVDSEQLVWTTVSNPVQVHV